MLLSGIWLFDFRYTLLVGFFLANLHDSGVYENNTHARHAPRAINDSTFPNKLYTVRNYRVPGKHFFVAVSMEISLFVFT